MAVYLVKTKVQPKDENDTSMSFKPLILNGCFIPKGKKTNRVKIEEQCKAFLLKNFKMDNPELTFEFVSFKFERYNNSFTIKEDSI